MKRMITAVAMVSLLLSGCSLFGPKTQVIYLEPSEPLVDYGVSTDFRETLKYGVYVGGWYDFLSWDLEDYEAQIVVQELSNLKSTGQTESAISSAVSEYFGDIADDVEEGYSWIWYNGRIFRITPDYTGIIPVENKYDAGDIYEVTPTLKDVLQKIRDYGFADYYEADYWNGKLEISPKRKDKTNVSISIVDFELEKYQIYQYDYIQYVVHELTVEVVSDTDIQTTLHMESPGWGDNIIDYDSYWLDLKAGKPERVTLQINCTYSENTIKDTFIVEVDNTHMSFSIWYEDPEQ